VITEAQENKLLLALSEQAAAWADFDKEDELQGAMEAFKAIDRHDYAEVLRAAWVDQKQARGTIEYDAAHRASKARCPHDGGTCHHSCTDSCFRMEVGAELTKPWDGFPVPGNRPVILNPLPDELGKDGFTPAELAAHEREEQGDG
jgi:hypothetical protein